MNRLGEHKVQIVTDSTADLPEPIVKEYDIEIVPLTVNLGEETFVDGTLSQPEFVEMMETSPELPRTSQPSPGDFISVFNEKAEDGPILCITISKHLSGTYQSASLAANSVEGEIEIFDTLVTTGPQAAQVLIAARLAEQGRSLEEIIEYLTPYREEQKILFVITDLTNVVKGGRLPRWQGQLASLLNINAVLEAEGGTIDLLEKVRGEEQVYERLIEMMEEHVTSAEGRILTVSHCANLEWAEWVADRLQHLNPDETLFVEAGTVISTHGGRGLVAVSI